jgi:hypothetical protein
MIKRQISLKTLSQNIFLADSFESLISDRFVEGALYVRCKKQLLMLKRKRTKFSKEMLAVCADALMKRLREILTEAQVYELGEEVQSRVKKDEFGYGMLFMNGYIYGEKNPNLKEQDFVRRKRKIRSLTRKAVEELGDTALIDFEANEEIYTQILIKGILYGQKKPLMNSLINL